MRTCHLTAVTLLVMISAACEQSTDAPALPAPAEVLGCYQLSRGVWSGPHESPDPPDRLILTDSIGSYLLERGRTLLRSWPDPDAMPFDMAWWQRPHSDTLQLIFNNGGYIGVRLLLSWRGDDWRGRIEAYTDVVPPVQASSSARLISQPCS
jgi:hypothetical protein